jgi:MoxR-like ATPase
MKGQTAELCFRCGKKPKLPKMAYCPNCKKEYDRERYLLRKKGSDKVKVSKPKKEVVQAKPVEVKPSEQIQELKKSEETVEIQGVGTAQVSVLEPPKEKPLFFDVDKNTSEVERVLKNNNSFTFLFKGEAGTGKTTFIKYLQWKFKKPIVRVNVTVNTEAQELKGKYIIRRDGNGQIITEWVDGLVTTALKNDCWLQIEEVNFMQREHQSIFYSLLDERKEIILEDRDGQRISNPNLVVFLTMNPLAFLKPLLSALKSRVDGEYFFSHPNASRQRDILIKKHGVPEKLAEQVAKTIELIRKQYDRLQVSSREAESWVRILKIKGDGYITDKADVLSAFKHALAFKLTDDEVIRNGLVSVAEAVMEGKIGYDQILDGGEKNVEQ